MARTEHVEEKLEGAAAAAQDLVHEGAHRVRQTSQDLVDRAAPLLEQGRSWIRAQPLAALGLALTLGYGLGALWGRR